MFGSLRPLTGTTGRLLPLDCSQAMRAGSSTEAFRAPELGGPVRFRTTMIDFGQESIRSSQLKGAFPLKMNRLQFEEFGNKIVFL